MSIIEEIEREMVSVAGPIASFVVKHQAKLLGQEEVSDLPPEKIRPFLENVVKASLFDPLVQEDVLKKLKKRYLR